MTATVNVTVAVRSSVVPSLLKAMRPKQWIKNLLLFAGFVFTLNERWRPFSPEMWDFLGRSALACLLFSLVSSSVYLINDVIDVEKDRLHPTKRNRPIASGALSPADRRDRRDRPHAGVSLCGGFYLSPPFAAVAGAYLVLQLGYVFALKQVVLLDVFIIAAGFVLRAISGAVVIGAEISPWLYTVTLLGALFLGLCKRRNELLLLDAGAAQHRKILAVLHALAARQPHQHRCLVDDHGLLPLHLHLAQAAPQQPHDADDPVRDLRDVPLPLPRSPPERGRQPRRGLPA